MTMTQFLPARRSSFVALLILVCASVVCGQGAIPVHEDVTSERDEILVEGLPVIEDEPLVVEVDDYLETLNTSELERICIDRGFDVVPRSDGMPLERSDFLAAARRCLSLEDEMNAILAKNPELAAELDAEIKRMQQHKERLEDEREQLLAQTAALKKQLEEAGKFAQNNGTDVASTTKLSPEDMSFKEVLIESFSQLYDRVGTDILVAWKYLKPVLKPVFGGLQLVWRHSRPHVHAAQKELSKRAQQLYSVAQNKLQQKLSNSDNEKQSNDLGI